MKHNIIFSSSALFVLAVQLSCGANQSAKDKSVSSTFTAEAYNDRVGRLRAGDAVCTAFLSSDQQITTAYHCLERAPGEIHDIRNISFELGSGETIELKEIVDLLPRKDLARISLTKEYPHFLGSGVKSGASLKLIAYDLDSGKLEAQDNCLIDEEIASAGVFSYSCPSKGHYSGAPILEGETVVGIHLGYKPKIDRRVGLDFSLLHDEKSDILEIEYVKEGCHTRASVGLGHTRMHVRGCDPISPIVDAFEDLTNRKSQVKADVQNTAAIVASKKAEYDAIIARIEAATQTVDQCVAEARNESNADKGGQCIATFESTMNTILSDIMILSEAIEQDYKEQVKAEIRAGAGSQIAKVQAVEQAWNEYTTCMVNTRSIADVKAKSPAIKACRDQMRSKIWIVVAKPQLPPGDFCQPGFPSGRPPRLPTRPCTL